MAMLNNQRVFTRPGIPQNYDAVAPSTEKRVPCHVSSRRRTTIFSNVAMVMKTIIYYCFTNIR